MVCVSVDAILPSSVRVEIFCSYSETFCFEIECLNQSNNNRKDKIPSRSETRDLVTLQNRDALENNDENHSDHITNHVTSYHSPDRLSRCGTQRVITTSKSRYLRNKGLTLRCSLSSYSVIEKGDNFNKNKN